MSKRSETPVILNERSETPVILSKRSETPVILSERSESKDLYSPAFPQFPSLRAGFTTRHLAGHLSGLAQRLGVQEYSIATLNQIHSSQVVQVSSMPEQTEGDALITNHPNTVLTIKTADCAPLLMVDPVHRAIAAIHAGWRGLEAGIIENTVAALATAYGSAPTDLHVAIGPSICQKCFEIGPEVAEKFFDKLGPHAPLVHGNTDRWHLDLAQSCKQVCVDQKISTKNIEITPLCTSCRTDLLYSYRREGPETGRLIGFIALTS